MYRVPVGRGVRSLADRKSALRAAPDVRFAGGVLVDPATQEPVLYTENLFIKFIDEADPDDCAAVLRDAGLAIKEKVDLRDERVLRRGAGGHRASGVRHRSRPAEARRRRVLPPRADSPAQRARISSSQQWHLKKTTVDGVVVDAHANVEAAHEITRGEGVTIA